MKNIKDITLLAFAVVGFYTIITAFSSTESNQPQQVVNGTPESHVWEMLIAKDCLICFKKYWRGSLISK